LPALLHRTKEQQQILAAENRSQSKASFVCKSCVAKIGLAGLASLAARVNPKKRNTPYSANPKSIELRFRVS